ncbi:MAG: hypothetical protein RL266_306 [Bacteroidota bacterium]|jgi:hypothetical protein
MKNLIGLVGIVLLTHSALAQNELDALRYSQIEVLGSARYSSMGGAFGALGGDMAGMSTNPAGIGVFTRTTGSVSMSVLSAATDANFSGVTTSDSKVNFNIANAGFVARFKRKKDSDRQWAWKAFQLGVSYNRTANFHRRTAIINTKATSSLIDAWVNGLNEEGIAYPDIPNEFIPSGQNTAAYMGWHSFLIDTVPGSATSYLRNVIPNYGQTQRVRELTKGGMGEVAVSFGGNFGNALYFGATVGIPRINYELERSYTESDSQDTISNFSSFTQTDYLKASGTGFNFKFGLIYRPAKWVRIGAAIHTPTYFEIDEAYSSFLSSDLDGVQYNQSTLQGTFGYGLQTPFRAIGSLAFVIGKVGLISADYEYVNYSLARFRSRDYGFDTENLDVKNRLSWAGNIRVGTEWRIQMMSVRAGFGLNADPYTSKLNFNDSRYSVGLGLRLERFSIDLGYNLHRTVSSYELYDFANVPLAKTTTLDHSVILSVGFGF